MKPIRSADISATKSRKFNDIAIAFSKNRFTDDVAQVKNANSIKQAIKNLVLTRRGERLFNMDTGCGVLNLLFEPLDPFVIDTIKREIINTINQYEKRVQLLKCDAVPFYESGKVSITITYKIVGLPVVESVSFVLQRPS
tara:strand:+ start:6182 stop:6601 length:420 start_codon:yes stop_codon:yes gene_type:complete